MSARSRANLDTACAALGAAFGFVPFVPRLVRAAFTGPRDRRELAARLRSGLGTKPCEPPSSPPPRAPRILLVAGEPSGDIHAANLAAALRRAAPDADLSGLGGPRMVAAGVRVSRDLVSDPVMGVWPVVRRSPEFLALYRDMLLRFEEDPPDVVVGVDYPGLNLRLARAARRRGVPFVEYVAPQVWAWAPWRTAKLARAVDLVLPILPFEQSIFEAAGTRAPYVGHPLFEHLSARRADAAWSARLRDGMPPGAPLIAILPGSRRSEVTGCLAVQADAAVRIAAAHPGARFVVALAAERLRPLVEAAIEGRAIDVRIAPPEHSDDAMASADAAITVSGTVTLHLAHHGVPAVVVYRAGAAARMLSRLLLTTPWFALPNLVACADVVPEILVAPGDGDRVAGALEPLLPGGSARDECMRRLAEVRSRLATPGTSDRAAAWVLASIRRPTA